MKHSNRLLATLTALLLCLSFLVSCNSSPDTPADTTALPDGAETTAAESTPDAEDDPTALTIVKNGASDYRIIYSEKLSDTLTTVATDLCKKIEEKTGVRLEARDDFEHSKIEGSAATDYEILLGTVRENKYFDYTAPEMTIFDYHITVVGTRVLILGGSADAVANGVRYFIDTYLTEASAEGWKIAKDTSYTYVLDRSNTMKFMTQNLLNNNTEYAGEVHYLTGQPVDQKGKNSIEKRKPRIRDIILKEMPDAMGMQEATGWAPYFSADAKLRQAGYKLISSDKDAKLSIIYNQNTLELLESASIWLTEDPENLRCSVLWNSSGNPRLAFFACFRHRGSGETVIFINTHIGFDNPTLQQNQCRVVAEYCNQLQEKYDGAPVVCVGDFNTKRDSVHYKQFFESAPQMGDTKFTALESSEGSGSMNGLGTKSPSAAKNPIDQIFASKDDFYVLTYKVDYTCFGDGTFAGGEFASDHYAVVATMLIAPEA